MAVSTIDPNGLNIGQIGGRRNLFLNGAMKVAQRATTATSISSSGYHTMDRWELSISGQDQLVVTVSQNSSNIVDGFENSYKIETTTAESSVDSTEYLIFRQKLEGQDLQHLAHGTSSAKSVTLSFWIKSSVTGAYGLFLYKPTSVRIIGSTYTINSANTWEYKTVTFAGDTSGAIANNNAMGMYMGMMLMAGSGLTSTDNTSWTDYTSDTLAYGHTANGVVTTLNATWEITGLQLEVGDTATPFEHRPFGEEQLACKRYYWQFTGNSRVYAFQYHPSYRFAIVQHPVEMRATPTIAAVTYGGGTDLTAYQYDNYHYKAYIASAHDTDLTARYIDTLKCDAEL